MYNVRACVYGTGVPVITFPPRAGPLTFMLNSHDLRRPAKKACSISPVAVKMNVVLQKLNEKDCCDIKTSS